MTDGILILDFGSQVTQLIATIGTPEQVASERSAFEQDAVVATTALNTGQSNKQPAKSGGIVIDLDQRAVDLLHEAGLGGGG